MKKTLIITLCSLALVFVACKKPVEPTPEPVDYAINYVGDYLGQYTFTITSMNNQPMSNMTFPIDNIGMLITKGAEANTVNATVTVDNETRQTTGTATEQKVDFGTIPLTIDKPDQGYQFELNLEMEGTKTDSDILNINGSFSGSGSFIFAGNETILNEVSGTLTGKLVSLPIPENL